ncbi:DUF2231 domain-containing protein [Microbacterium hominis]|uniref:DUF2231 domain-containing protein n=1 Tax=Microbacterium hominis TaxID=162426 RepID=A0A7D4UG31_9MICO|nr:DUF2231 domain-containing protein [Microbacterium hominis]QKJ19069.1 hypothetical protein HQM25_06570 [Microbacterium hominis]
MDQIRSAGAFEIAGLPLHPLIVHAVVILTPLTVLALLLGTFWPAARGRLGIVTPLGALVVLILVPVTVQAGAALKEIVGPLPSVERHEALGRMFLPWAIGLFVVAAGQWLWYRYWRDDVGKRSPGGARAVTVVIAVLAVLVGVGAMVVLALIGDSGARAVWGPVVGG